jgi:long-chain acyl-CoA synthetase
MRDRLYADPAGKFLHDAILDSCNRFAEKTALVDVSVRDATGAPRRISYADLGDSIVSVARGLVASEMQPGERVGVFLPNSWEFCVACHAVTLAGGIPTPLNPSYREREVTYQLDNSGASLLITNGPLISGMTFKQLPELRAIYTTREHVAGSIPFSTLFSRERGVLPKPTASPEEVLAALPYSSGTTGLPKGVRLSHSNLLTNVYQFLAPGEAATFTKDEIVLSFLPLYHIYGLNVLMNPTLIAGGTLVLMPRFDSAAVCQIIAEDQITFLPMVPPVLNALSLAAERGEFPTSHRIRAAKSGAAPLAPELPLRFRSLTGIPVKQGYGMTEASPVTHCGFIEEGLYKPDSIGRQMAQTDCKIVREDGTEAEPDECGELVMRGPQFMRGYWNAPEASAEVLRDGWYWSGDVAQRDERGFFTIVDRRKEMIKYKGFAIAPAEVESVLLEHPKVQDCGVVGRPDVECGEAPCAFVVLRPGNDCSAALEAELCGHVAERLTKYKQPREVRFVSGIPRNPSGKILRRELRAQL